VAVILALLACVADLDARDETGVDPVAGAAGTPVGLVSVDRGDGLARSAFWTLLTPGAPGVTDAGEGCLRTRDATPDVVQAVPAGAVRVGDATLQPVIEYSDWTYLPRPVDLDNPLPVNIEGDGDIPPASGALTVPPSPDWWWDGAQVRWTPAGEALTATLTSLVAEGWVVHCALGDTGAWTPPWGLLPAGDGPLLVLSRQRPTAIDLGDGRAITLLGRASVLGPLPPRPP